MNERSLANLLSVISTERRLRILKTLLESQEPLSSGFIGQLTDIPEGPISGNLTILTEAGLLMRRKHGRSVFYAVNNNMVKEIVNFFQGTENETE